MAKDIVVLDIDGCVIDPHPERLERIRARDWEGYHKLHHLDTVNPVGAAVYSMFLSRPEYRCVFVTGREEQARGYTLRHLAEALGNRILGTPLLMRPNGTRESFNSEHHDTILKPRLLVAHGYSLRDIFLVFEDRQSVVDMWRSHGITVYQTQPGDF